MILCEYGCGQEAKHQFKNGKWCCNINTCFCPEMKRKNSILNKGREKSKETRKKLSDSLKGKKKSINHRRNLSKSHTGKKLSEEHKKKISHSNSGRKLSKKHKEKLRKSRLGVPGYYKGKKLSIEHKSKFKRTIKQLKSKYPIFTTIEELRYKPKFEKLRIIQGRCKNHNCPNSKEQGGWFDLGNRQIEQRIYALENPNGNDGSYFYCSDKCKNECPLFGLQYDPFRINEDKLYNPEEHQIFREEVLKRAKNKCEYCGKKATDVHHSRPQKLEPGFALDPDFGVACCKKCHYKYGHKIGTECSTGNLANKICNK